MREPSPRDALFVEQDPDKAIEENTTEKELTVIDEVYTAENALTEMQSNLGNRTKRHSPIKVDTGDTRQSLPQFSVEKEHSAT